MTQDDQPFVTFINIFEVAAEDADAVAAKWRERAAVMSTKPGFLDSRLHKARSAQGRFQLVNVAHWESQEAWEAASTDMDFASRAQAAQQATDTPLRPNTGLYDIVAQF
ncbi:antibiotic biosynthesis monooxygenase family protein [Streptomyces sp. 8N114]|uniref:antibiotic biosynthesis monooxygenase family protein n=1 Tax=Streptomyces sp. 8N114 TaxID=3457419 RepID=UPI003FD005CF